MGRDLKIGLAMFPIGAACGFVCGYFIFFGCLLFAFLFGREPFNPRDVGEIFGLFFLPVFLGGIPAAPFGFVLTPLAYFFLGFRRMSNQELVKAARLIAAGTILSGLLGGLVHWFIALVTALFGFVLSCGWAADYLEERKYRQRAG